MKKIPAEKNTSENASSTTLQSIINIQNTMENINFRKLITQVKLKGNFESVLSEINKAYLVKIFKISELKTETIIQMFMILQQKFYLHRTSSNQEFWYENELRIFIWLLFAYLHVFQKNITELNEQDWTYFSIIFNYKSTIFFEFQAMLLIKNNGKPSSWTLEETKLLKSIIQQKNYQNQWNSIARDLYFRSNKIYLRNPKQCRQKWKNHLDPAKLHSKWTQSEDLTLLTCISKHGKKWSRAVKQLNETRTEHMVKNRYKSLTSILNKKYKGRKSLEQVQMILIHKLTKMLQKQKKHLAEIKSEEDPINSGKNTTNQMEGTSELKYQVSSESCQIKYLQERDLKHLDYFDGNSNESVDNQLFSNSRELIYFKIDEGIMPSKLYEMDDERIFFHEDACYRKYSIENEHIFRI